MNGLSASREGVLLLYRKDTEPLYPSFMYSLVSHFFPVSIQYCRYWIDALIACYIPFLTLGLI